ncbi:MAG: phosphotransferase [Muribaculaceae bacterium]|nr:phosphotransferase [Muribaculaceae bacterium]
MQEIIDLYTSTFGRPPASVAQLAGAASARRYYRLADEAGSTVIATAGTSAAENEAFIYMTGRFGAMGLPVPRIIAVSADRMNYLQSDAGTVSLFEYLAPARQSREYDARSIAALEEVMAALARFHNADDPGFDYSLCLPRPEMDYRSVMWDLNYFKYCFLKPSGIEFDEEKLENDFETLASAILGAGFDCIMLRDCQSRNVMVGSDGSPVFIDYQGARRGNRLYDVVSFLWQARASYPAELRSRLVDHYLGCCGFDAGSRAVHRQRLPHFILLRTLQVLGVYGFVGLVKRKEHFISSIPAAMANLREIAGSGIEGMPELARVIGALAALPQFGATLPPADHLTVTVSSFSYKLGWPEDNSGNGGGFVFDCRALHNPGCYERYRQLTGMDSPVIEFLDAEPEVAKFLESVYSLVDASVERYISRGFTSLSVAFGCTGGRHRSVYCAEHLAAHLAAKYRITVELKHREQKVSKTLESL